MRSRADRRLALDLNAVLGQSEDEVLGPAIHTRVEDRDVFVCAWILQLEPRQLRTVAGSDMAAEMRQRGPI